MMLMVVKRLMFLVFFLILNLRMYFIIVIVNF